MNIIEYRAMVAQEKAEAEAKANVQTEQTPTVTTQQTPQAQGEGNTIPVVEGAEGEAQVEQGSNQTVEIDGQEYTIEELKRGYMRQSDYTKKTQELSRTRQLQERTSKFYQDVLSNEEIRAKLQEEGIEYADPQQLQYEALQAEHQDMLLEREIERLQDTYEDFDALQVLRYASENQIPNVEDAFHIMYSKGYFDVDEDNSASEVVDVEALKEQIRQEVLQSLQSNVDTGTIIASRAETAPVRDNSPVLSAQEQKVARMMRMSEEEYAKWRNKR